MNLGWCEECMERAPVDGETLCAQCTAYISKSRSHQIERLEAALRDAISGYRYIEQNHGRLYGVGWDRVYAYETLISEVPPPEGI